MFQFLNKMIHNNSLKKVFGSTGGQAAVVLILVIAVVLIFYAVTLNFGYFSQVKGMTTISHPKPHPSYPVREKKA